LRKSRNGLRLVHRCSFVHTTDLFRITNEEPVETHVKRHIMKRSEKNREIRFNSLPLLQRDLLRDLFHERKNDYIGHSFPMKRLRLLRTRYQSSPLAWFSIHMWLIMLLLLLLSCCVQIFLVVSFFFSFSSLLSFRFLFFLFSFCLSLPLFLFPLFLFILFW
jgi:hypothetical protein